MPGLIARRDRVASRRGISNLDAFRGELGSEKFDQGDDQATLDDQRAEQPFQKIRLHSFDAGLGRIASMPASTLPLSAFTAALSVLVARVWRWRGQNLPLSVRCLYETMGADVLTCRALALRLAGARFRVAA